MVQEYHIILHHSVIPHHSWMTKLLWKKWKWLEWLFNDISPLWFSFLVILNILKWHRNGGMRRNGGVLEGKIKTEFWDTCHSWVIQVILLSFHNLYAIPRHSVISFILAPRVYYYPRPPLGAMPKYVFHHSSHSNTIQSFLDHSIYHHSDVIPVSWFILAPRVLLPRPPWCHAKIFIPSFLTHSSHSDRGLMLSWGKGVWGVSITLASGQAPQTPFPRDSIDPPIIPLSFCHSWLIPVIPISFKSFFYNFINVIPLSFYHSWLVAHSLQSLYHHSDVIQSFLAHSVIIPSFQYHSNIPSSFRHYTIIPMSFNHS